MRKSIKITVAVLFLYVLSTYARQNTQILESKKKKVIMLSPAGDAEHPGRALVDGYERGATLQLAESMAQMLRNEHGMRVVITRSPGEVITPLQVASLANRTSPDLFLSLHACGQDDPKSNIYFYHLVYNPLVDFALRAIDPHALIPLREAHFQNIHTTIKTAKNMLVSLQESAKQRFLKAHELISVPCKPLIGIVPPALMIEVSIHEKGALQYIAKSLVESIVVALKD